MTAVREGKYWPRATQVLSTLNESLCAWPWQIGTTIARTASCQTTAHHDTYAIPASRGQPDDQPSATTSTSAAASTATSCLISAFAQLNEPFRPLEHEGATAAGGRGVVLLSAQNGTCAPAVRSRCPCNILLTRARGGHTQTCPQEAAREGDREGDRARLDAGTAGGAGHALGACAIGTRHNRAGRGCGGFGAQEEAAVES